MFLGQYDFDGDPDHLVTAYDRLMTNIPTASVFFHTCIRRDGGITIIDACPSASDFAATAADPDLRALMRDAGLPTPTVTPLGESHSARAAPAYVN